MSNAKITQSNVSNYFVMPVPIYADFGKGWVYLGTATIVGSSTIDIKDVVLPVAPQKLAIAPLSDVLKNGIEVVTQ